MMKHVAAAIALLIAPHSGNADEAHCVADHSVSVAVDRARYETIVQRMRQPYLTPAESSALQYWDGQSEVSADDIRAEKVD